MYEISKQERFESAHQIEGHIDPLTGGPGKCSRCHGHGYKVTVVLRSKRVQPIGFTIDYYWVGAILKNIIGDWDHQFLNDLPDFKGINTTAENIAAVLYTRFISGVENFPELIKALSDTGTVVYYTEVKETDGTSARYYHHGYLGGPC